MNKVLIATKRKSEDVKELQDSIFKLENLLNSVMMGKEFIKLKQQDVAMNEDLEIFKNFKALVKSKLGNDEYIELIKKAEKLSR